MTPHPHSSDPANPGLPGFARFRAREIARSATRLQSRLNAGDGRMYSENFPVGKPRLPAVFRRALEAGGSKLSCRKVSLFGTPDSRSRLPRKLVQGGTAMSTLK